MSRRALRHGSSVAGLRGITPWKLLADRGAPAGRKSKKDVEGSGGAGYRGCAERSPVLEEPLVRPGDAFPELYSMPPPERVQPADIEQFARHAVRLGRIERERGLRVDDGADQR